MMMRGQMMLAGGLAALMALGGCAATASGGPPATVGALAAAQPGQQRGNVDLPRFPALSPDGEWVSFSWRGHLWKVSTDGGQALRLTTHPQDESRSAWSPDGTRIAFNSDRTGYTNIHMMYADGTGVRQVTDIDRSCTLTGFGVDEQGREVLTFHSFLEGDIYRAARPYMVSTDGGDLIRVHDAFGEHPVVSPNGQRVLFTRGGSSWTRRHYRGPDDRDVWLYERCDGSFRRLTEWEGNDGKAQWIDDRILLYLSDRELDTVNLYRMDLNRGEAGAVRLTSFDVDDIDDFSVSADGTTVALTVWDTLYTLDLTRRGARPVPLRISAIEDERDNFELKSIGRDVSEARLSPDGQVMAVVAYGRVYVRNVAERSPTRRVTNSHGRARNLAWSPDGLKLYFVTDDDGTESIYAATVALTRSEVREAFEKALNDAKNDAKPEPEPELEPEPEPEPADDDEIEDRGEDAGDDQPEEEEKEEEKKDEKKKDDLPKELDPKRWHDAMRFNIEPVVATTVFNDRDPNPSPDGKSLLFRRSRGDLMFLDLDSGDMRRIVEGWDARTDARWSPDSRYLAYQQNDLDFNSDIWIVPVDGSADPVNISRHPANEYNPRWSADGKILSFISQRIGREYDVWMVYLDKDLEAMTRLELEEYYDEAVKAAKRIKPLPVRKPDAKNEKRNDEKESEKENREAAPAKPLDLDDAWLRLRRVTRLTGNEWNNEITAGGDYYVFTGTTDSSGLFSIKWDGSDLKRLTGSVNVQHLTLTGDKAVFVSGGRAGTVTVPGGRVEYFDISDRLRIDLQEQSSQKFVEAARILGEMFYHPTMKDLDWEALTDKYHSLALAARTADEFNSVAARFLGELNGSHLGIRAPGDSTPNREPLGRLGTVHHRVRITLPEHGLPARANDGEDGLEAHAPALAQAREIEGFKVTDIIPFGPAALGAMALEVGDVITAIELEPFGPTDTVETHLRGRSGDETIVTIQRPVGDAYVELNVLLTPISWGAQRSLQYDAWRLNNARLVDEWSDGRIGYIHIEGMNQASLDVYERDLYAAAGGKDGLLIDVRNNGGGSTADRVLASIMVRPHAYTIPRGADPNAVGHYPQDRLFITRYTLPINMLCNEKSFSNAEIVSHAFKTLGRGTLVGQQTYGGVISTGGTSLIDGTTVRLPFRGWYLFDGTDMENNGAMPDLLIPQTPEAESDENDEQLRAAVDDLLKRLD